MIRTSSLALLALSSVLLILPLTALKPGLPATLKADEPAYYLAALSLVEDGDLKVGVEDRLRLFEDYPYLPAKNLIVMSDDGWRTLYYGKPFIYSLAAAPWLAVWGTNGIVLFNMAMLVAMIWMGFAYLRKYNDDTLSALMAAGFFLLSTSFSYVFWLHPEVFNMFATACCLFFGLWALQSPTADGQPAPARWSAWSRFMASPWALVCSAGGLALGVYNKPMLAAVGVPVCFELMRHRRWRQLGIWLAAAAVTTAGLAGIAVALTGQPTAYLVDLRAGFTVNNPYDELVPTLPEVANPSPDNPNAVQIDVDNLEALGAGWWWIFRIPKTTFAELSEDIGYFFFGRHTGLFIYQPFAALALLLFLLHARRSAHRWVLLLCLGGIGFFALIFIHFNWHGGGGFVGNRYFIMAYPGFLFLVRQIRPPALLLPVYALAGLLVGPLLFNPFGSPTPAPTLQSHVRNLPLHALPVEFSISSTIPGYLGKVQDGVWLVGRRDQVLIRDEEFWLQGGDEVELWLHTEKPLTRPVFEISSWVVDNPATVDLVGRKQNLLLSPHKVRLELLTDQPTKIRLERANETAAVHEAAKIYVYRLAVTTQRGMMPRWHGMPGPAFYVGAVLEFNGQDAAANRAAKRAAATARTDSAGVAQ